jgi:hypothetical protein
MGLIAIFRGFCRHVRYCGKGLLSVRGVEGFAQMVQGARFGERLKVPHNKSWAGQNATRLLQCPLR